MNGEMHAIAPPQGEASTPGARVPTAGAALASAASAAATFELERQAARAQLFTHTALGRNALRLHEVESFAYGLLDVLLTKGVVSGDEVSQAVERVREETKERGEAVGVGVALRVDGPAEAEAPTVTVNCAERMPVCHSICCKLDFALTVDEVEAGQVKWDLGRPYQIRHDADGFCTHRHRRLRRLHPSSGRLSHV